MRFSIPVAYFSGGLLCSLIVYQVGRQAFPGAHPAHLRLNGGKAIDGVVVVAPNWEVNPKAPSKFILSTEQPEGLSRETPLQEIGVAELAQLKFKLPALKSGTPYHFHGVLYLCKKGESSVCTRENRDYLIDVEDLDVAGQDRLVLRFKFD